MKNGKPARGMTLIGFILLLFVIGFFAYIAMKLFPIYQEYYSVVRAMKQVQQEPGVAGKSPEQIRDSLNRKMYISYVYSVKPANIRVMRSSEGYLLIVKYEVRGNLMYNLDYIAVFDKTVNLTRGTSG